MTELNIDASKFYINENINELKQYEYLNIPSNSKYYKDFSNWIRNDVYQYTSSNNKHIMQILTDLYGYNGKSEYPHKKSMENFLNEYLSSVLFKMTFSIGELKNIEPYEYIQLIPLNNLSENNRLSREGKVYSLK